MSKSAAEYKLERRKRAAVDGMCHTCCVVAVARQKSICKKCSAGATVRSARRRGAIRQKAANERAVSILEDGGDAYALDGDHRSAIKSYRRAFNLSTHDVGTHTRLAVKLGRSAYHRGIATAADDWFNLALETTVPGVATSGSVAQLYMQQMRTLWSNSRTGDVVALCERVLDRATAQTNTELILCARLTLALVLHMLSQNDEASRQLAAIDTRTLPQEDGVLCTYNRAYGLVQASAGDADRAFASFAKALKHAEQDHDAYAFLTILSTNGICAMSLGHIELAAASFLKALNTARENNHIWMLAYLSLGYAQVLGRQGNRHLAHAYVTQAVTFDNPPPVLIEALAEIGIPIAMDCDDAHLLQRCANDEALTFTFASGEPPRVGPVAAAFARYYASIGRLSEARRILDKALDVVTNADQSYDLPLIVAQFGQPRQFSRARRILRTRMQLPHAEVAVAHLHFFDALVLRRNQDIGGSIREATIAATLFEKLRWASLQTAATLLCRSLAANASDQRPDAARNIASFDLTAREQSVAEFAIAGLSNREISDRLRITVRTVESHMTSVLSRMHLRSRHQLLESMTK